MPMLVLLAEIKVNILKEEKLNREISITCQLKAFDLEMSKK